MIGLKKLILEQQDDPDKIKIKTFQDWLDINHPNWIGCTDGACTNGKQLNKGGGYGNWGPNSDRMWYFKYEGTKTYGNWFEANYDAKNPTSVLTKKISGTSSNLPNQNKNVTNKSENTFNTYRKQFVFKDGNGTKIPIKYNELIGDSIDGFLEKGFDESTSFIAGILSIDEYKNLIASMIGPNDLMDKYEKALPKLKVFFEHVVYNQRKGLITLLEQDFTEFVVNKGIPTRKTSTPINQPTYTNRYDQLYTIVRGTKLPYEKGQRSPFIGGPKQEIGHSDTSELFDQSFEDNLRNWQRTNGVPETGKLDKETICKMYPRMCENINKSSTGESDPKKTAAKPQSEVFRVLSPYLMRFSKTARPSKDNCKLLIDNYAYQAKNYRKNKEAGIESDVTSQELTPIKKQIMACLNNHPVLKLQLRDMSEMKKSDSPFYLYAEPESSEQATTK